MVAEAGGSEHGKRIALVIGNAHYKKYGELSNPENDARRIAHKLESLLFDVQLELDVTWEHMRDILSAEFWPKLEQADVGLFYYAGHGVQVRGKNYLLPVDSDIRREADLKLRAFELDMIVSAMRRATKTSLFFLDACRDNPLPRTSETPETRSLTRSHGLARMEIPEEVFIAFSTQPDNVALDRPSQGSAENSPFASALLQHIDSPNISIGDMMIEVRQEVWRNTGGQQIPWERSSLFHPFCFNAVVSIGEPAMTPEARQRFLRDEKIRRKAVTWELVCKSASIPLLESFLKDFPDSEYAEAAEKLIAQLYRRSILRKLLFWPASVLMGVIILAAIFFAGRAAILLSHKMHQTDLIGGDMTFQSLDRPEAPEKMGLARCVWQCATTLSCKALSFAARKKGGYCYLKSEVLFERQVSSPTRPTTSYYLWTMPKKSIWEVDYAVALEGEVIDQKGNPFPPKDQKHLWRFGARSIATKTSNIQCQKQCLKLHDKCRGFSYSTLEKKCWLFKEVYGHLKVKGDYVALPGFVSGKR